MHKVHNLKLKNVIFLGTDWTDKLKIEILY